MAHKHKSKHIIYSADQDDFIEIEDKFDWEYFLLTVCAYAVLFVGIVTLPVWILPALIWAKLSKDETNGWGKK